MAEQIITQGTPIESSLPATLTNGSEGFDFLSIVRFIFYALVLMKLISIMFIRKRKPSLKERVYRKFLFAHQEIYRFFTEEDKQIM